MKRATNTCFLLACAVLAMLPGAGKAATSGVVTQTNDGVYLGAGGSRGVLLSQDGNEWSAAAGAPRSLQDPARPAFITTVVALPARAALIADDYGRLFRTDNAGASFTPSDDGLPVPFAWRVKPVSLAVDPGRADTVYALLTVPIHSEKSETRIYRSENAGRTWRALKELPPAGDWSALSVSQDQGTMVEVRGASRTLRFADRAPLHRDSLATPLAATAPRARRAPVPGLTSHGMDIDIGSIAVLFDDGTFVSLNDLADLFKPDFPNTLVRYTPTLPPAYSLAYAATAVALAPSGTDLALDGMGDETVVAKPLPFDFPFYGTTFPTGTNLYISDNGSITIGSPDPSDTFETETQLSAGSPRIAAMWDDLDPTAGGAVWYDSTVAGQVTVKWLGIPEFGFPDTNSFAVTLYQSGDIDMVYETLNMFDGLTGLSPGMGAALSYADFSRDIPFTSPFGEAVYEWFANEFWTRRVAQRFYACHADAYDQLVVVGQANYPYPTAGSQEPFQFPIAFADLVRNDVSGIGLDPTLDDSVSYGSANVLRSVAVAGTFLDYPDVPTDPLDTFDVCRPATGLDPFAQTIAHQWLAYVDFDEGGVDNPALRGRNGTHWSFFHNTSTLAGGAASVAEGVEWRDNLDGSYSSISGFGGFSQLDLYLMGLLPSASVPDFFVLDTFTDRGNCGGGPDSCRPDSTPDICATASATIKTVSINQVITAEGPRSPGPGPGVAPLRLAWILVVPPPDNVADPTQVTKADAYRQAFEAFYASATGGLHAATSTLMPAAKLPSNGVGNNLRGIKEFNRHAKLDWRAGAIAPPRYTIHMTDMVSLLDDSAAGIGSTPSEHTDIEFWRDYNAVTLRPMLFFYEVHYRDCQEVTQYP